MKKLLVLSALFIFAATTSFAQNYMVVNTEKIFKSIDEYSAVVAQLDEEAKGYQKEIDDAYAKVENAYNSYVSVRSSLSQSEQQKREEAIVNNEKKIIAYQEQIFGDNGVMVKAREERLEPIQKRALETISEYAKENNFGLVLDISTNPMVIFYSPETDKTEQIIKILK